MDTAGTATRRDPDKPRDHLDVFREFIDHLERNARITGCARQTPAGQRPLAGSLPTVMAGPSRSKNGVLSPLRRPSVKSGSLHGPADRLRG